MHTLDQIGDNSIILFYLHLNLTLYTLKIVFIFTALFIPSGNEKGNLSISEELPQLVIILLILITILFDSRVVLLGEITNQSLLVVKGLKALMHLHIEDSKELEVKQSQLKDSLLQKHCQNIN